MPGAQRMDFCSVLEFSKSKAKFDESVAKKHVWQITTFSTFPFYSAGISKLRY